MRRYTEHDIEEAFFATPSRLMKIWRKARLFALLHPGIIRMYLRGSLLTMFGAAGNRYLKAYLAVKQHPLYTRNSKMEVRALVGIYLFAHYLFPTYPAKKEEEMLLFTLLITLIDCMADTIGDEFESTVVQEIVGDLAGAEKFLRILEDAFLLCLEGKFAISKIDLDPATRAVFATFEDVVKQIKRKNMSSVDQIVWDELGNGIRYIFASHYASLRLRERKYDGHNGVDDSLKSFAGAISYYTVFFVAIVSRLRYKKIREMISKKGTLAKFRDIAIHMSELTYCVNGYKSYEREFREGDFSSWVYVYALHEGFFTVREIQQYVYNGMPEEQFHSLIMKMDSEKIQTFFIREVTKRLNKLIQKSQGIMNEQYIENLIRIMQMQLASAGGEEHEQLARYVQSNREYIVSR